jgi:hypothetical protein
MAHQNALGRLGVHQSVNFSTSAGTIANPISSQCCLVRICVTAAANVVIGNNPTATAATGALLSANLPEYFKCSPGESVSAIGAAAGQLDVQEII